MTILNDKQISALCLNQPKPLISPYVEHQVHANGVPITSRGISGHGYDLSLSPIIRRINPDHQGPIDPCEFPVDYFTDPIHFQLGDKIMLAPGEFILGVTNEYICMPDDLMAICMEKSTIARSNIEVTVTPMEAGWYGFLTLEIHNRNKVPAVLTAGMGITQALFFKGEPAGLTYDNRGGKYQDQPQVPVIPRAKKL